MGGYPLKNGRPIRENSNIGEYFEEVSSINLIKIEDEVPQSSNESSSSSMISKKPSLQISTHDFANSNPKIVMISMKQSRGSISHRSNNRYSNFGSYLEEADNNVD